MKTPKKTLALLIVSILAFPLLFMILADFVSPHARDSDDVSGQAYMKFPEGSIRYQLNEDRDNQSAQRHETVLLLHGFNGSLNTWDPVWETINACTDTTIRLDIPGYGKSDWSSLDYSLPAQAERIIGLMDRLGIKKTVLVGVSMGGSLAAYLSASYPEKFESVILLAPSGYPGALKLKGIYGSFLEPGIYNDFAKLLVINNLYMNLFNDSKLIHALSVTSSYGDKWVDTISGNNTPTLILWSEGDTKAQFEFAQATSGIFGQSALVTLDKSVGHRLPKVRGDLVEEAVCDTVKGMGLHTVAEKIQNLSGQ